MKWKVTMYICSSEVKRFWHTTKTTCEMNFLEKRFFPIFRIFWCIAEVKQQWSSIKHHFMRFTFIEVSYELKFVDSWWFRSLKTIKHWLRIKIEKKRFFEFFIFSTFQIQNDRFVRKCPNTVFCSKITHKIGLSYKN